MSDAPFERLRAIMAALRDPENGCPWDRSQSWSDIVPHTLEEVYELVDAIERGDHAHLAEELGDLLFQVVFYARLGEEEGRFDLPGIAARLADKLERRHPHVFGDRQLISIDAVHASWEQIKQQEREQKSRGEQSSQMDDVPLALPELTRARKLQKRAAAVGFDWQQPQAVLPKLDEERAELAAAMADGDAEAVAEEFGDLLFTCVNLGRLLGLRADSALRAANHKFEQRFRTMERLVVAQKQQLAELTPEQWEVFWAEAKAQEGVQA